MEQIVEVLKEIDSTLCIIGIELAIGIVVNLFK